MSRMAACRPEALGLKTDRKVPRGSCGSRTDDCIDSGVANRLEELFVASRVSLLAAAEEGAKKGVGDFGCVAIEKEKVGRGCVAAAVLIEKAKGFGGGESVGGSAPFDFSDGCDGCDGCGGRGSGEENANIGR
jgi:hypothetical protein